MTCRLRIFAVLVVLTAMGLMRGVTESERGEVAIREDVPCRGVCDGRDADEVPRHSLVGVRSNGEPQR